MSSAKNAMINMATCLAEVEMLRNAFDNVSVRTLHRLQHGPDPVLTKEWMEYNWKIGAELQKWQARFYAHCELDL